MPLLIMKCPLPKVSSLLHRIEQTLEHLNIQHMTIQLETSAHKHDDKTLCSAVLNTHHHSHHSHAH
ncbi:Co Zn Cd efflux system component [Staphylococcus gallinarum]|uniref:Co Zn Cd efflux system component n=1 Tax=Staphylococcus gallinarum TaxID=1293 RepID=A0A380FK25_STAGA|nr:Co Zn Cd efflux system component [Staphylococcus gallinarum]